MAVNSICRKTKDSRRSKDRENLFDDFEAIKFVILQHNCGFESKRSGQQQRVVRGFISE